MSWVAALPFIEFAINSTANASTGLTPFYVVYGQNGVLPIDHALVGTPPPSTTTATDFASACHLVVETAHK